MTTAAELYLTDVSTLTNEDLDQAVETVAEALNEETDNTSGYYHKLLDLQDAIFEEVEERS